MNVNNGNNGDNNDNDNDNKDNVKHTMAITMIMIIVSSQPSKFLIWMIYNFPQSPSTRQRFIHHHQQMFTVST